MLHQALATALAAAALLPAGVCAAADYPVTDTEVKAIPEVPRPGYLKPYVDPVFGTRVTRITGDPGTPIPVVGGVWGEVARHHYSKDQAWNADGSLLILDRHRGRPNPIFLDGRTYRPRFTRRPPGEDRWHPTEPDLRIFVKGNRTGVWNVRTGQVTVAGTFEGYSLLKFGPGEGNPSRDGARLAVLAQRGGKQVAFAYDLVRRHKWPDIDLDGVEVDWVSVSALGTYVVLNGVIDGGRDRTQVYDLEGRKVGPLWTKYGRPSHYDLTVDDAGDEVAVGVSKSKPGQGRLIKRTLRDGAVTVLTPGGWPSHTSARNIRRPGWVYATYQGRSRNWPPFSDEIVAVRTDGSLHVQRLAHMHTRPGDYFSEAHASPSPDGRKVIFASNWEAESRRPLAAYVVELPEPK